MVSGMAKERSDAFEAQQIHLPESSAFPVTG